MPGASTTETRHRAPVAWYSFIAAVSQAIGLGWLYTIAVGHYWWHYRLGTAGANGMALAGIEFPGAVAIATLSGCLIVWRSGRRGRSAALAFWDSLLGIALVLGVLFAFEVWRTTQGRNAEHALFRHEPAAHASGSRTSRPGV
jgi:hypothetical protein